MYAHTSTVGGETTLFTCFLVRASYPPLNTSAPLPGEGICLMIYVHSLHPHTYNSTAACKWFFYLIQIQKQTNKYTNKQTNKHVSINPFQVVYLFQVSKHLSKFCLSTIFFPTSFLYSICLFPIQGFENPNFSWLIWTVNPCFWKFALKNPKNLKKN